MTLPSLGPRGEGWVVGQVALFWVTIAVGAGWNGAWSGTARSMTTLLAGATGIAGAILVVRGKADLGAAWTPLPRPRESAPLVETGIYALVRHPIYGGVVLIALAWGLLAASPAVLLVTLALLAFFRLKSAREEAWLIERHPGYAAYRARTKRLIPFLY